MDMSSSMVVAAVVVVVVVVAAVVVVVVAAIIVYYRMSVSLCLFPLFYNVDNQIFVFTHSNSLDVPHKFICDLENLILAWAWIAKHGVHLAVGRE
jgi:hypothetical protein